MRITEADALVLKFIFISFLVLPYVFKKKDIKKMKWAKFLENLEIKE